MRSSSRAGGYTLVELMVVLAIIGILVSMTIPAVNVVRQRMHETQCRDNLRQLAIAAIAYETTHGELPGHLQKFGEFRGGVDPADPGSYGGNVPRHLKLGGWQVALLSKLDNQPIYERWSLDRYPLLSDGRGEIAATDSGYSKIAAANLEIFQCAGASSSLAMHGKNQYIGNMGMHTPTLPFRYSRPGERPQTVNFVRTMALANGVFNNRYAGFDATNPNRLVPTGRSVRTEDFKDGAGNTMLFTESQQAQPWHLTSLSGNTRHLTDIRRTGRVDVVVYPIESRYLQGAVWHFEDDRAFASAPSVNPIHRVNGGDVYLDYMNSTNYADYARPSSLHPSGGVNMAMGDGQVRFVEENIDYRIYQALMTPNGRASDVPHNEFVPLQL